MERLSELIVRVAQPGRVTWIGVRAARHVDVTAVVSAEVTPEGLVGDHGRPGKRAVTLVQHEHLSAIGQFLGRDAVAPEALRRNLVIAGINLTSLRNREIQIGSVRLHITGPCAPCSRMEQAFGPGGYSAVRGHGGMTASVVASGTVKIGDVVEPLKTPPP